MAGIVSGPVPGAASTILSAVFERIAGRLDLPASKWLAVIYALTHCGHPIELRIGTDARFLPHTGQIGNTSGSRL